MGICFQTMPGVLGIHYLLGINMEHGVHVPCNNDLRNIQHNNVFNSVCGLCYYISSQIFSHSPFHFALEHYAFDLFLWCVHATRYGISITNILGPVGPVML